MATEQVRILVVDDEASVRNLLQRILEEAGHQVTTTTSGKEALYRVSLGEADVVLLDIRMPEMSGTEVLSKLATESPDTCVIMVTAVIDTETAVNAMKLGAYDYITKPFERDNVKDKVQKAIERWTRQQSEKQRYLQLSEKIIEQTHLMQDQFTELVNSLAREHKLLHQVVAKQSGGGKSLLSALPKELQEPIPSIDEFKNALLRILRRT